jgi:hypothetical protein
MRTRLFTFFATASLLVAGITISPRTAVGHLAPAQTSDSTADVVWIADGSTVPGAYATLDRNGSSLTVNLHTTGLAPGAYTLWWGIYNYPENCDYDPCGGPPELGFPDDTKPEVQAFWVNATGHVVSRGRSDNFAAHLTIGGPYAGEIIVSTGPGLLNPAGAQVQLVLRYHGPAIPGMLPLQTSMYNGGCPDGGPPCEDVQFVVFP